ncbi:MAG: hypothetical protein HGA31_05925 [Candidatus Moranbacteria bacterium]|nr:hypothetical protein [Candidatus Moranbacteria bacterium]
MIRPFFFLVLSASLLWMPPACPAKERAAKVHRESESVRVRHGASKSRGRAVHVTRRPRRHLQGQSMFVWNELLSGDIASYAAMLKATGISCVIVKYADGCEWGVRNTRGEFQTHLNQRMIAGFHAAGIRCYGYVTAWLKPGSDIRKTVRHTVNILHRTDVEGVVIDDVFAYGTNPKQTEYLFSNVRHHIDTCPNCRGKMLSFSTFPNVWSRRDLRWDIPLRYADAYLPQIYWAVKKTTPEEAVSAFQAEWRNYRRAHRKRVRARVIPVASTAGVSPIQIRRFVTACKRAGYSDRAYFRLGTTSAAEREIIRMTGKNDRN